MKKILLTLMALSYILAFSGTALAEMLLFWDKDCEYCKELNVYLDENNYREKFQIQSYEIRDSELNEAYYLQKSKEVGYSDLLFPLLVHDKNYFDGTTAIKEYLNSLAGQLESTEVVEEEASYLSEDDSRLLTSLIKEEKTKEPDDENSQNKTTTEKASKLSPYYLLLFLIPLGAAAFYKLRQPK